ncbi:TIR domain-containing protein [Frankia sp. AiPs1]|uniref:TIR domain-containing protein n=1 Tax=Frankia sp. AiPs1 TaxID=573493 RepID=UPI0020442430|nr:TIR domain-containing protein [Frankia sp. AiPs1]MCM3925375.1 TIR domain-containing protein [Frankia sp. AiPs1]
MSHRHGPSCPAGNADRAIDCQSTGLSREFRFSRIEPRCIAHIGRRPGVGASNPAKAPGGMLTIMDDTNPRGAAVPEPAGAGGRAKYDFFVSHHASDGTWAKWVAWQLEDAGYRVLVQDWDFAPGTRWTTFLQRALAQSERTITLVSETYIKSAYGQPEWEHAYQNDPHGLERKLLPIRVADCRLPELLHGIRAFDLFDVADEAEASLLLLQWIEHARTGRVKPTTKPPFPGSTDTDPGPPGETHRRHFSAEALLAGAPLATMAEYPVRFDDEGTMVLDLEDLQRACQRVIADRNVRGAVELIYLTTQNHVDVQQSVGAIDLVQRVKKEFAAELAQMDGPQAQQRNIIEPLINLTHLVGAMFAHLPIEFVLHDTRDPLRSVCAVQNGFTGRRVGSPASNVALDRIKNPRRAEAAIYQTILPDGRKLRSTTIPIHHRVFGLIALLCINVDTEKFKPEAKGLKKLLPALSYLPDEVVKEIF